MDTCGITASPMYCGSSVAHVPGRCGLRGSSTFLMAFHSIYLAYGALLGWVFPNGLHELFYMKFGFRMKRENFLAPRFGPSGRSET